MGDKAYHNLQV